MFGARSKKRRKSHTRKLLKRKRGHVLKQVTAVVPDDPSQGLDAHALHQLRASLQTLHRDIRHDSGPGPRAAAQALTELDTSLAKLAAVKTAAPGPGTQKLLEDGLTALRNAHAHAKRAGHDWQL